jgi:carbamoyl-phosphate synthase small subunit
MSLRGGEVHVLPATATGDDLLALSPAGRLLSNGPATRPPPTDRSRRPAGARGRVCRCSAICFGNQVLGRALGSAPTSCATATAA